MAFSQAFSDNGVKARASAPYRVNAGIVASLLAAALVQLFVIPLWVLPLSPSLGLLVAVLVALSTPLNNAAIHEAVHGRLAPTDAANEAAGRALATASGVSFEVIRFGHLAHHRFNRHALDRPDVLDPARSRLSGTLAFYGHLLGGLYLTEMAATALAFLPRRWIVALIDRAFSLEEPAILAIRLAAHRALARRRRLTSMRTDAAITLALYGTAFWLYGTAWPILLVAMAIRAAIVSMQDNAPHYGTPPVIGAPAVDARLPGWAALFVLNQNLHAVHHDHPELPWTALPSRATRPRELYLGMVLRQLRGPMRREP